MPAAELADLLDRTARHAAGLEADHFDGLREGQAPAVVALCCSDSRVPQTGMWDDPDPGWLFTPSTIGNSVTELVDGERVVEGSVVYPLVYTDTGTAVVVGHTGCGAVTAALETVRGEDDGASQPPGVRHRLAALEPVVERGLADPRVGPDRAEAPVVDQLVEYNVDTQVRRLRTAPEVPADVTTYGFVYDIHGRYGRPGRAVLTNVAGETDPDRLRAQVPARHADGVGRLLPGEGQDREGDGDGERA